MSDDKDREVRPWDFLNPNTEYSTEEIAAHRLEICKGCEFFRPKTQTCKKCGCFMAVKSMLSNAKCPVGKW